MDELIQIFQLIGGGLLFMSLAIMVVLLIIIMDSTNKNKE